MIIARRPCLVSFVLFDQDPPRTRPMAQTAVIYLFIIHLFIYLKQSIKIPLGLENKYIII